MLRRDITQGSQWKSLTSASPKKASSNKSKVKVILNMLFDGRGVFLSNFLTQGQMISKKFFQDFIRRHLHSVRKKKRELCQGKLWLFHHNNGYAYSPLSSDSFWQIKKITLLDKPTFWPYVDPGDTCPSRSWGSSGDPF